MIEPLINGKGNEIGFMPVVQILNWRGRGLQLADPLPAEIQHHTTYAAAAAPELRKRSRHSSAFWNTGREGNVCACGCGVAALSE